MVVNRLPLTWGKRMNQCPGPIRHDIYMLQIQQINYQMKYVLSSYMDGYTFRTTWKVRFRLRIPCWNTMVWKSQPLAVCG